MSGSTYVEAQNVHAGYVLAQGSAAGEVASVVREDAYVSIVLTDGTEHRFSYGYRVLVSSFWPKGFVPSEAIVPCASSCLCPDDCNCRRPWRSNVCGCRAHEEETMSRTVTVREVSALNDRLAPWRIEKATMPRTSGRGVYFTTQARNVDTGEVIYRSPSGWTLETRGAALDAIEAVRASELSEQDKEHARTLGYVPVAGTYENPDRPDITRSDDPRALAALISGLTREAVITDAEVAAVVEWCREWVRECEWIEDSEDLDDLSDAVVLRSCHRHIDGGLAFVLADVRRCEEIVSRQEEADHLLGKHEDSPPAGGSQDADEIALEAWPIGSRVVVFEDGVRQDAVYEVIGAWRGDLRLRNVDNGATHCRHPRHVADAAASDPHAVFSVVDRNARDPRDVLAGPFLTRERAEEEAGQWAGAVDAYVRPETVDGERFARILAHWRDVDESIAPSEQDELQARADAIYAAEREEEETYVRFGSDCYVPSRDYLRDVPVALARETAKRLADDMLAEAVDLWNLLDAAGATNDPGRDTTAVETMQAVLGRIASYEPAGGHRTRPDGLDDDTAALLKIDAQADDERAEEILSGAIVKWALVFEEDCDSHPYTLVRLVVKDGAMVPTTAVQLTPNDPLAIMANAARTDGASLDALTID